MVPFWSTPFLSRGAVCPSSFNFCVSYAVSPINTIIPTMVITNSSWEEGKNILIRDAKITPMSPISRKLPQEVKSLDVVNPYKDMAPNMEPHIKNVLTIDVLVYIKNIDDRVIPFNAL